VIRHDSDPKDTGMRTCLRSLMATLCAIGLGTAAQSATAATLYTTGAHTTFAAVGSTAGATLSSPLVFTSATSAINICSGSTLTTAVSDNLGGNVELTVTAGTFTSCSPLPLTGLYATP
jgi:hypothetical protein